MKKALTLGLLVLLAGVNVACARNLDLVAHKAKYAEVLAELKAKKAPKTSTVKTVAKTALKTVVIATAIVAATYGLDYALQWASAQGYIANLSFYEYGTFVAAVQKAYAYLIATPFAQQALEKAKSLSETLNPYLVQAKELAQTSFVKAKDLATTGFNKAYDFFTRFFMTKNATCPIETNTCSLFEGLN